MAATITTFLHYFHGITPIEYKQVRIIIPAADILTLNTIPITIATGISQRIIVPVEEPIYGLTFGGPQITGNTTLCLYHQGATLGTNELYNVDIGQTANSILHFTRKMITTGKQYIPGADLKLSVATGNPTGVGLLSSIEVSLLYKIIGITTT